MGFAGVLAGPLVRSSYRAGRLWARATVARGGSVPEHLTHLLDRLRYLHYGIAFILAFIGLKLVFHAMHVNELPFINGGEPIEWAPEISTWMSLGVIILSMTVATVASLIASARDKRKAVDAPQA